MTQKLSIHAGAVSPYELEVTIGSEVGGFDLTLITAGAFQILRGSARDEATYVEWDGVLSSAAATDSGTQVTLTHVYVEGDVTEPGTIYLRAKLSHPDGPIYSRTFPLLVNSPF